MSLDILLARMTRIVHDERRPFSYKDFLSFDHDGITYRFEHGTIRNYFAKLRKSGKIELVYMSSVAFYTLKGIKVGRVMTPNHTGAISSFHPVLNHSQKRYLHFLLNIPMDKPGIHDVDLIFRVEGLWEVIQMYPRGLVKDIDMKSNKDIRLHELDFGDHLVNTTIHRTDTVTVKIACSFTPIPLSLQGLASLTGSITRVEERLQTVIDEYLGTNLKSHILSSLMKCKGPIPNCTTWTAKMWHFGQDALTSYSGDMFDMSWGDTLGVFHHAYSKLFPSKNKVRIRKEIQECPNKPWVEAFTEKMRLIDERGPNYLDEQFNKSFGDFTKP